MFDFDINIKAYKEVIFIYSNTHYGLYLTYLFRKNGHKVKLYINNYELFDSYDNYILYLKEYVDVFINYIDEKKFTLIESFLVINLDKINNLSISKLNEMYNNYVGN